MKLRLPAIVAALATVGCAHVRNESRTIAVNGTSLYYEVRGAGPTVLLISSATGDAGHYDRVRQILAQDFTVVTYDRRGNSRSPRPANWTSTTMEEQVEDAVQLIHALKIEPVAVFGTSGSADIGLELAIHHPELLRCLVMHEPGMMTLLADPSKVHNIIGPALKKGLDAGGPRGGLEAFLRVVIGDSTFESIDPVVRERMLNNAPVMLSVEMDMWFRYRPSDEAVRVVKTPTTILLARDSPYTAFFDEIGAWLGSRVKVTTIKVPGGHAGYFDRAGEIAATLHNVFANCSK